MQEVIIQSWEPKNHPANKMKPSDADKVRKFLGSISSQNPIEMYKVQMERNEIMTYMPTSYINALAWKMAEDLLSKKWWQFWK